MREALTWKHGTVVTLKSGLRLKCCWPREIDGSKSSHVYALGLTNRPDAYYSSTGEFDEWFADEANARLTEQALPIWQSNGRFVRCLIIDPGPSIIEEHPEWGEVSL